MASHAQHQRRDELGEAVRLADWETARRLAEELHLELAEIVRQRSAPGPGREIARRFHRDGLFSLGWQRVLHAPPATRSAVDRYNATLRTV